MLEGGVPHGHVVFESCPVWNRIARTHAETSTGRHLPKEVPCVFLHLLNRSALEQFIGYIAHKGDTIAIFPFHFDDIHARRIDGLQNIYAGLYDIRHQRCYVAVRMHDEDPVLFIAYGPEEKPRRFRVDKNDAIPIESAFVLPFIGQALLEQMLAGKTLLVEKDKEFGGREILEFDLTDFSDAWEQLSKLTSEAQEANANEE